MARFQGDTTKVAFFNESGTYASSPMTVGLWPGQVVSNTLTDNENKIVDRYASTLSRDIASVDLGPSEVTGTLTYRPQDMRLPFHAIGSVADISGTNYYHTATEIESDVMQNAMTSGPLNPPYSFTLEDSKQAPGTGKNFIRTIKGCVIDTCSLTATEGEKVTGEVAYIAKELTPSSGTTHDITESLTTPYLWSHCSLTLAGSPIVTATDIKFDINRNAQGNPYVNNTRYISTPTHNERDYTLSTTIDLDSDSAMMLYELKKNNTSFNGVFDLDNDSTTGSQHTIFTMSGCYVMSMDPPSESTGLSSTTVEIMPESVSAQSWDKHEAYNPTSVGPVYESWDETCTNLASILSTPITVEQFFTVGANGPSVDFTLSGASMNFVMVSGTSQTGSLFDMNVYINKDGTPVASGVVPNASIPIVDADDGSLVSGTANPTVYFGATPTLEAGSQYGLAWIPSGEGSEFSWGYGQSDTPKYSGGNLFINSVEYTDEDVNFFQILGEAQFS